MAKKAVILVDMLNDFVTGSLKCERAQRIIGPLQNLVEAARGNGVPVIYSNDCHYKGVDKELDLWGEHAMAGTEGAEVIPELKPEFGDYIVPKRRYSGFFQTDLQHTTADAYFWGFHILVPKDGTEAFAEEDYQQGLDYLAKVYGAEITTVADVLKGF